MELKRPLIVFDLETTGTWVEKDRILEIGMIKCLPDGKRETFIKRVNPGISIPAAVSEITGITDADVKDAPSFRQIASEVAAFIGDSDLAGFNAARFDIPVLMREFTDAGIGFDLRGRDVYDAQKIYHLHEKRDLTAAYKFYCGKDIRQAHTALGDAEATLEILESQVNAYSKATNDLEGLKDLDYGKDDSYYDKDGMFRWWNNELYPTFGKYKGKTTLEHIARKDRRYLEWILDADFNDEVKRMVKDALLGKFPERN